MGETVTEEEFHDLWMNISSGVAGEFYPKGVSDRRGEYLRDQAVIYIKLRSELRRRGLIGESPGTDITGS